MRMGTGYEIGSSPFECNSKSGNAIEKGLLMRIDLKYTRAENNEYIRLQRIKVRL